MTGARRSLGHFLMHCRKLPRSVPRARLPAALKRVYRHAKRTRRARTRLCTATAAAAWLIRRMSRTSSGGKPVARISRRSTDDTISCAGGSFPVALF